MWRRAYNLSLINENFGYRISSFENTKDSMWWIEKLEDIGFVAKNNGFRKGIPKIEEGKDEAFKDMGISATREKKFAWRIDMEWPNSGLKPRKRESPKMKARRPTIQTPFTLDVLEKFYTYELPYVEYEYI